MQDISVDISRIKFSDWYSSSMLQLDCCQHNSLRNSACHKPRLEFLGTIVSQPRDRYFHISSMNSFISRIRP